jgi:hypothetical protein
MADHDGLYRRLFDHPDMVRELLREFLAGPWLDDLDLEAMTRENATFNAPTGDRRDGDMVWRIPRRDGGDTYLILLLEFQSTSDHWMALRVLVYAGLLWQHLVNEKRLPPDGRLPPILPIVLYNGDRRWAAPLALSELVGLSGDSPLWRWQPAMRYQIVDEGAFPEDDLARRDALLALLFRLESSPDPAQVVVLTDALLAWFQGHPGFERVRSVFVEMLGALLAPRGSGARGSGAGRVVGDEEHAGDTLGSLGAEPGSGAAREAARGRAEGRAEGRAKGRAKRRAKGPPGR